MPISRRDFVKVGVAAATLVAVPRPLMARLGAKPEPLPPIDDPRLKELLAHALESARGAGAAYADARLTHDRNRGFFFASVSDAEGMAVGVRALVDGYWGFASGPVWSPEEMARLGREAVAQAKTNALGKRRLVELAPVPAVSNGHWRMPVRIDPFTVPPAEVADFLASLAIFVSRTPGAEVQKNSCDFFTQERAFGSSEGSYCTQQVYRTSGEFVMAVSRDGRGGGGALDCLSPAGVGWELYRDQPLREAIRQLMAEAYADMKLPVKPVDVGRYDTVFDAQSMATLVDMTFGHATELDRALGYEANAGGTSYLNDPFAMLGSYQAGAPLLSVLANRSDVGGCATVKWDDEGVAPDDFPLVTDGVLTNFQTTRESAGWLAGWYGKHGRPFRSHGCAAAESAIFAPLQHEPNLTIAPGPEALDFDALVSGVTDGIAIKQLDVDVDFQHLNGLGSGKAYEVKRGKRTAQIAGAGVLFRAPELWKGLLKVGGQASMRRFGTEAVKGEPVQKTFHSVTAPPALFKQLTLIDPLRKA
jgi:TldD protein